MSYARSRLTAIHSASSDYSSPTTSISYEATSAVVTKTWTTRVQATTGGVTLDLANFTTVYEVIVKNLDTTNYVDVGWTYASATSKAKVPPGEWMRIPTPVTIANDLTLTANTASCYCEVTITATA